MLTQTGAKPTMKAPASGVTVRMYDLKGEGDCFLVAFRAEDDTPRYMLIDCGIFVGTGGGADQLRDVAKDIGKASGNHLHVVVATHEHWDHLIGFHYGRETLGSSKMVIDEVWLAWTENVEEDQLARYLHQQYEAASMALAAAAMQLDTVDDPRAGAVSDVLAYNWDFEGLVGVTTNEVMDSVHKELGRHPARYCYPDSPPVTLPGVPALRFYNLGPPRDESLLKILEGGSALRGEPPALDEATAFYSAVLASFGAELLGASEHPMCERANQRSRPFTDTIGITEEEAREYRVNEEFFFQEHYGLAHEDPHEYWRHIDMDWLSTVGQLALHMDNYTNNTSLVLALEFTETGKVLLFPGDAQAGSWLSWKDNSWTVEDEGGERKVISGMDLVRRTAFLKVGHHGSHNGTSVKYLRQMSDDLVAMIPVNQSWAESKDWEHPGMALLGELEKQTKGRIIRADTRLPDAKPTGLPQHQWNEFLDNVQQDRSSKKLWIQYTVAE